MLFFLCVLVASILYYVRTVYGVVNTHAIKERVIYDFLGWRWLLMKERMWQLSRVLLSADGISCVGVIIVWVPAWVRNCLGTWVSNRSHASLQNMCSDNPLGRWKNYFEFREYVSCNLFVLFLKKFRTSRLLSYYFGKIRKHSEQLYFDEKWRQKRERQTF